MQQTPNPYGEHQQQESGYQYFPPANSYQPPSQSQPVYFEAPPMEKKKSVQAVISPLILRYYSWGIGIFFVVHLAYLLFLQTRPNIAQETSLRVISDILVLLGALVCSAVCGFAAWTLYQMQEQKRDLVVRRAWLALSSLGIASLGYAIGQAIWTWNEATLSTPPFPSFSDFFYIGVYIFDWLGIALLMPRNSTVAGRTRLLLDAGIAVASMMAISWYLVLGPTIAGLSGDPLAKIVSLAYPLGDLSLSVAAAILLFGSSSGSALNKTIGRLAIGVTLMPITSIFYSYYTMAGAYHTGFLSDIGWPVGWLFIGWAALSYPNDLLALANQRRAYEPARGSTRLRTAGAALRAITPALLALFTCGLLLFMVALRNTAPLIQVVFVCAGLFLLPIIRQALTLIDNLILNDRLRTALDQSQQAFQDSQRELLSTTLRAEQFEELRTNIEELQNVHAILARGDLSARARVQGPLAPVAQSLNLLIERMGRWSQQLQQNRVLEQEAELIYQSLEHLSEGQLASNLPTTPSALPTGRALFATTRLQNRLHTRFRRLRETADLLATRLSALNDLTARGKQAADATSSMQAKQAFMQIEKSLEHSQDATRDLQAQTTIYTQEMGPQQQAPGISQSGIRPESRNRVPGLSRIPLSRE